MSKIGLSKMANRRQALEDRASQKRRELGITGKPGLYIPNKRKLEGRHLGEAGKYGPKNAPSKKARMEKKAFTAAEAGTAIGLGALAYGGHKLKQRYRNKQIDKEVKRRMEKKASFKLTEQVKKGIAESIGFEFNPSDK